MIEVLDEILEGEPVYRIRDKNGNIVLDDVSLEMITPTIQKGTPINKALFDSIRSYIENLIPNNYVIDIATPSSKSQLPINCGFKPVIVLVVMHEANVASTSGILRAAICIGDKGISIKSDDSNDNINITLSDTGCVINNSFSTRNTYRYIAFKG